ncbi:MAG TPA: PPK2 family polyphosphate kinase [Cryptosporangiaceae bacterium]|nr:PPK2 family polyphosphate kinase [Cryptosporangiaceae bacterium]
MATLEHVGMRDLLRVDQRTLDLAAIDPASTPGVPSGLSRKHAKAWSRDQLGLIGDELASLQERLFAGGKEGEGRRVLLVLQAMDCGGKDGTVKNVAGAMNPLGLRITGFGAPTAAELRHHFLWRIRRALPGPGLVGVFNRSHYEDVLVARVEGLVPQQVWERRYAEINRFEARAEADGLRIVKVMLHISAEEQKKRLLERLDDPTKHWKYNPGDLDARAKWDSYQDAYAAALRRCSTPAAPWYVVPADRKWYRNWAVAHLLWETMEAMNPRYPPPMFDVAAERQRLLAAD